MVVLGQFECFDASKTSRSQTFLAHTFRGSSCAVQGFWVLESGQLEAEEQMPEEAAKSWKIFQDGATTKHGTTTEKRSGRTTVNDDTEHVTLCSQSFAEKKYEETAILVERINNTIIEDEKRIAAAFKHFDKDSSGVLERQDRKAVRRQGMGYGESTGREYWLMGVEDELPDLSEFKFLCAYLGWSAEESNSIDVNKDGTVSLAELQNFVGFLGGVQKFFEQRRKRVTESRKDVKEVCPVVGVEVGARVRSHFYYKNGQKSSSWREAQVLSVNCHTDSGRGILLEFGFEDLKGNSDWVARQVVPISWILSSHEETSLAAALREVGILDDSQALYKMLLPMSELQSIQGLVSCQRAALALVRQQATLSHEMLGPERRNQSISWRPGDYELQAVFSWVKDLAPLVIHVHLDNMGQFLETDEYYRNQFETKTSCGAIDDGNETRKGWEQALFGDSYESAKPFDRCKYGALNVTNDYRGVTSAMQYGDSYLVLKDVRLRATFCATDSGGIQGSRLGVCDRYAHVLAEYNDSELQEQRRESQREITRVAMAALPHIENGAPSGNVPKSAWPQVLRAYSEDCSQEWITVGYPKLAKRDTGRFVYEVEFYEHVETPQVGLLSELYEKRLGVMSPTGGVGDDAHGWALDPQHGCRMASCNGRLADVGVAEVGWVRAFQEKGGWMTTTAAGVPCWDGNASTFDTFVVACKWLQKSLKPSERSQAAPKIWQSLSGAARSVVKHLDPDDYTDDDGMTRLLNVLRASPLQQLPIPDSFGKLEHWHHLRKGPNETMAQLIVKEEEMFQDLQQSLVRARADRALSHVVTPGPARMDPPSTPSQSPVAGAQRRASEQREFPPDTVPTVTLGSGGGSGSNTLANFFEDELRGYRLMKAAKLSQSERQAVLVQTQNSTHYYAIRQALRTLYAEESERSQLHDRGRSAKAWWADGEWEPEQEELELDWNEWSPTSWDQWEDEPNSFWYDGWEEDEWGYDDSWWPNEEELNPIEESEIPEERQYHEVTMDVVNGKMMEIKGKMLQMGIPTPLQLNMTLDEYHQRLEKFGRMDGVPMTPSTKAPSSAARSSPSEVPSSPEPKKASQKKGVPPEGPLEKEIKEMAIKGYLAAKKEKELDVTKGTPQMIPDGPEVVMIHSEEEEWEAPTEKGKWLIRVHNAPRLAMFSPARVTSSPIDEAQLTGKRKTHMKALIEGSSQVLIEDDYKESEDPHRLLQERWTGETWFEISSAQASSGPQKRAPKLSASKAVKKKAKATPLEGEDTAANETTGSGAVIPMPDDSLQEALRERGTLRRIGWQQVKSDKCLFVLTDDSPEKNVISIVRKKELEKQIREQEESFFTAIAILAEQSGKQFVGVAVDLAAKKLWLRGANGNRSGFGVNGLWSEKPSFSNLPDGIALYPALSFKGRASFVFQELKHPPPASLGEFSAWPQTFQGKFRIDCPKVGSSDVSDVYKEFQVHGEVCLKKHVCRLVANNKYRAAWQRSFGTSASSVRTELGRNSEKW
ncbi:Hypothetical protein (Fragment) [Durusdinium trenchii]|uniref:EF-hand domain-containing protein n=1 Tax=Durusdinium trenchii TaxID=1381693 RepID=A0ABP0I111_9DINO